MEILKSTSILILFINILSVSAMIDNLLLKYLMEHKDGCKPHENKDAQNGFLACTTEMQARMKAMPKPKSNFNYDRNAEQICTLDFTKCWGDMGKALEKCLPASMHKEYFTNPVKVISQAQNYACADQGKQLQHFMDNVQICFNETQPKLIDCGQMFSEFSQKYSDKQFLLENACQDLTKLGSCVVDALATCKDKSPADFIRKVIHKSFQGTDCQEDINKAFPDSATSLSAFSFLLVVAGMFSLLVNS